MLKKFYLFSFIYLACSQLVNAETYIIADTGRTIDLKAYLNRTDVEPITQKPAFTAEDAKVAIGANFPLISTIRLGTFTSYEIKEPLPANFALVGTGVESQEWLKKRYEDIKAVSAMVIVIDAPNLESYKRFEAVLKRAGMTVTKSNSKPFESIVQAYPALVSNGKVIQ